MVRFSFLWYHLLTSLLAFGTNFCPPAPPPQEPSPATAIPPWPPTYDMRASTITMACNYSGMLNEAYANFGIVDVDWSNNKDGSPSTWANQHPMNADVSLEQQAAALKAASCPDKCPLPKGCKKRDDCPSKRVFVYRNLVKALPWFGTVREKLEDPAYRDFFVPFGGASTSNGSIPSAHVPACDSNFKPAKCSSLYHDQSQTPQYPSGGLLDGTCAAPCDCGTIPCGEYVWNHRNGSLLRNWLIEDFLSGPLGLGSANVDGFFLDDGWLPAHGRNGSIPGGPSEYERHAVEDMALSRDDVCSMYEAWKNTTAAAIDAIHARGGWVWQSLQPAGCGQQPTCATYLRSACTNTSSEQKSAKLFNWPLMDGTPSQNAIPPEQRLTGLAIFLAARGPYAWIGHAWEGTCNAQSPFPDELARDYGEPMGLCEETEPGKSGVFKRTWTKATVTVDCNKFVGSIDMHPLII